MNEIKNEIKIEPAGLGLLLRTRTKSRKNCTEEKILIIADLHIGYEEELNTSGIFIPRFQFKEIYSSLQLILKKTNPDVVIINGDLKHDFGNILRQEWKGVLKILDLLQKNNRKVILIKGNHDTILKPIVSRKKLKVRDYFIKNGTLIFHGDKLDKVVKLVNKKKWDIKLIVLAHEHPAVCIKDKTRREYFKCFLTGSAKNFKIIILPSFNPLVEGSNVLSDEWPTESLQNMLNTKLLQSAGLKFDNFEVVVPDKDNRNLYKFGSIKNLQNINK